MISFKRFLALSAVQGSQCVTFDCEIKVWLLNDPVHVTKYPSLSSPTSINKLDFNLSKCMEEARQSSLFTDVTLVAADGKGFKAHKVVLASQSQFFKIRFSSRWTEPLQLGYTGDRVEMTDVPAVVMEAILSYVYTGKVANIGNIACQLLPVAEPYGLVGLQKMCEEALAGSLTGSTVINTLICAAAHDAPDLKKACMEFIASNTASVKQSEWWGKLKTQQVYRDLWVELLEYNNNIMVSEKPSTSNATCSTHSGHNQLRLDSLKRRRINSKASSQPPFPHHQRFATTTNRGARIAFIMILIVLVALVAIVLIMIVRD